MRLELGSSIRCRDREFGELLDIVVAPQENRVTHLVVQPHGLDGVSRLVPIAYVELGGEGADSVALGLRSDEVQALDYATQFTSFELGARPETEPGWDVGVESVLSLPGDELGSLAGGALSPATGMMYDRVPTGEAEIRQATPIRSADDEYVGEMGGLLVSDGGTISHLVIERGHLWRRREVTIPIEVVARVETDGVTVSLSKAEIAALPSAKAGHSWW